MSKKISTLLLLALIVAVVLLSLSACNEAQFSLTLNGGDNSAYEQQVHTLKQGEQFVLPEVEGEQNHRILTGWRIGETVYQPGDAITVTEDMTLTAVWQLAKYDITFVYGLDGELSDVQNLEYGAMPVPPTVPDVNVSESLVKKFGGWDKEVTAVDGATTYTAQYTDFTVQVAITLNGGDNSAYEQQVHTLKQGEQFVLPEVEGEQNHRILTGWRIGETVYQPGDAITVTEDMTLTAVWQLAKYDVTFVYGINGELTDVQNLEYGATPVPPTVSDVNVSESLIKKFSGWDKEVTAVVGATTYTAQYTDFTVQVAITLNGGDNAAYEQRIENAVKGSEFTLPVLDDELNHYVLIGWNDGNTVLSPGATVTASSDLTYTAVWQLAKYDVTFVYGINGELTDVQNLEYGATPVPPTVSDVNVSESLIKKFSGWDKEVSAVVGATTYTAQYTDAERIYTLTFEENEYVKFYSADGQSEITSLDGTYQQSVSFTVKKNTGAYVIDMQIMCGDDALTPADGVYSVILGQDGMSVRQTGARWAMFEISVSATNASYLPFQTADLDYGTVVKLLAVGNEWYCDAAPTVTYGGVEIISDGTEVYDGKEYHTYSITVDKNANLVITGIIDNVPITVIDVYGESHVLDWNISYMTVGNQDSFNDEFDPMYVLFPYEGTNLRIWYDYNSNWDSICLFTTDSSMSARIYETETEYKAALAEYVKTVVLPQKGATNEYYLCYYKTDEVQKYKTGVTLPYTATDVQYRTSTATSWSTWTYTEEGPDNTAPHFSIWNETFADGTVLFVRFVLPNGETLPTLYDIDTNEAYTAQEYTFSNTVDDSTVDETVVCYRYVISGRDVHLSATFENTHTVSFVNGAAGYYTVYNVAGNSPNYSGIRVQDNGIYSFYVSYEKSISDILSKIQNNGDSWSFIEGYEPVVISGNATLTYRLDVYIYSWSGEVGSVKCYVDLKDITGDVSVDINCQKRASADIAITILDGIDIFIDDVLLEGEVGQVVTAPIFYDSKIKLVVNKDGYQFEGRLLNGTYKNQINVIYHYMNNGTSTQSNSYAGTMNASYTEFVFEFGSYSFKSEYDLTKPLEFQFSNLIPTRVNATQNTAKSEATDANGVSFPNGAPICASKDGNLAFDIVVPYGKVPTLYIQYADALSDGYLPYQYANVVKNENANTYSFDVASIRCDITWYIKLNAEMFDVTFRYGDETLTLNLPYGKSLSDISELPQSFSGEQDSTPGVFEIIGWSTTEGGEEDILMVDGEKTLWAVTQFTAAVAVYNGTYYTDLNTAFSTLNDSSTGNLDLVYSATNTPTLRAGNYNLPAGVTLRLPYALNAYGRTLAEEADGPSLFYADNSRGTVALVLGEGVTLNVYGKISVGGIVGYKVSAKPYQGQTSADYAILQLDGVINVQSGGTLDVNGYIVGNGSVHLLDGATSKLPFIVKDYKGGTNSSNVYSAGYVPFNVYEMPNIQTNYYIYYGAKEYAYAMLVALGGYNETEICAIGSDGMIRLEQGGYVLKKTTQITNPRYSESTKSYEPQYEFRTTLDIYGGGRDGALTLDLGFVQLGMEGMVMAIPYTYSNITLHSGQYGMYNMFKIMPGAKLTVANDATLTVKNQTVDGKTYLAGLIVYNEDFEEDHGTCKTFANSKQLLYPSQPNGVQEGGAFVVNGTLVLEGKFGGDIISEEAGAQIKVKSLPTHLSFSAGEAIQPSGVDSIIVTYEQTSAATVNGGALTLEQNKIYRSYANDDGSIAWR